MKLGIYYWSGTGNTREMAEMLAEIAQESLEVRITNDLNQVVEQEILEADVIALGSPSHGIERLARPVNTFMKRYGKKLEGKNIILFGSYGWGNGKFMEIWEKRVKKLEGKLLCSPILAVEEPDDDTRTLFANCVEQIK